MQLTLRIKQKDATCLNVIMLLVCNPVKGKCMDFLYIRSVTLFLLKYLLFGDGGFHDQESPMTHGKQCDIRRCL